MPQSRIPMTRVVAMLSCAMMAACSGGGTGGGTIAAPSAGPATTPAVVDTFCCSSLGPPSMGFAYGSGLPAGPIAAPPPASFGASQNQTAVPQGPSFDGSSGTYPANVTFPLILTSMQSVGFSGLSAGPADSDATLKVISSSANSHSLELVIPSLNVDLVFSDPESIVSNFDGYTRGASYVAVGTWGDDANGTRPLQHVATFLFGYETPSSAMPATGTANFVGTATTTVYKDVGNNLLVTSVNGNANISADFSSGQVTGALTQMKQWDGQKSTASTPSVFLPWNDVSLAARIATGTSRFSGSAAVTSAPGTTFSLAGSATGHVDGALYGPTAQYVGATWSLSDGAVSAMGLLTAKQ